MHPEVQQATAGDCPKCGMALHKSGETAPARALNGHSHAAAEPTLHVAARTTKPLKAGDRADVTMILKKKNGSPVTLNDLKETHTEKIHVLLIDPTLTDYHHEHPVPGSVPGEYRFSFTPKKKGAYRMWADVVPIATGKQEYVIADIGGAPSAGPIPDRASSLKAIVDGLTYSVELKEPLKAGRMTMSTLVVKKTDGSIFRNLEPIMGAYAHIVAFSEDYKTIAHVHPMGDEPKSSRDRGVGELQFHIQPANAGLLRVFVQVQIEGQSKFAPFTLAVQP